MNLKNTAVGVAVVVLLSTVAHAQTPAPTNAAATDQAPSSKKADRAANRAFAKRVQQAIYKTKGLQDTDIVVFAMAKTGHVTLAGFIMSEDQDQIATTAAGKVPGVTSVTSKLTLQEEGGG